MNYDDIDCSGSTNDVLEDGNISINPNPTRKILNISTEQNLERIEITNMMGQSIRKHNYNSQVDVSNIEENAANIISDKIGESFQKPPTIINGYPWE